MPGSDFELKHGFQWVPSSESKLKIRFQWVPDRDGKGTERDSPAILSPGPAGQPRGMVPQEKHAAKKRVSVGSGFRQLVPGSDQIFFCADP